jgi:glycosyltransferase involved in cell wall biosynthesis
LNTASPSIDVSVVTPMHNEEACIHEFYRRVTAVLAGLGRSYEIVLVNDGSTDATGEIIRDYCRRDGHVVGVFLSRNRGQCNAIYAGLQQSRGDNVLIMDGDLQHRPEDIPALLERMGEGFDLVKGMRENRSESLVLRRIPSRVANYLLRATSGCPVHDMGGFSCIRGEVARALRLRAGHHRLIPALVHLMGGSVSEVPTSAPPRFAGKSHYGLARSFDVLFDIVMLGFQASFKQRPVYLFGRISLGLFLLASLLLAWVLGGKIFFGEHMGSRPPFLMSILFYLASLGFMSTGLTLEMLSITQDAVTEAKPYMIREVVRGGGEG